MAANQGAGLVYGAYHIVDGELGHISGPFVTRSSPLAHHCLLRENIIQMHGAVMYDRKKLSEIGGYGRD